MNPEQIIEMVKNGQTDSHWIVFPYSKVRSFLVFFYKLSFTGLFLGSGIILWMGSPKPLNQDTTLITYSMVGIGIISALILLRHFYTLFFLKSNMIVLTEDSVVKSIRGKVTAWAYTEITALRQVVTQTKNSMPTYSIEFKDTKSDRVLELARGREFGPSQDIFTVLQTKVR